MRVKDIAMALLDHMGNALGSYLRVGIATIVVVLGVALVFSHLYLTLFDSCFSDALLHVINFVWGWVSWGWFLDWRSEGHLDKESRQ